MGLARGSKLDSVTVYFRYSFDGESHPATFSFRVASSASREVLNDKILARVKSWKKNFDSICLGSCLIDKDSLKFYRTSF